MMEPSLGGDKYNMGDCVQMCKGIKSKYVGVTVCMLTRAYTYDQSLCKAVCHQRLPTSAIIQTMCSKEAFQKTLVKSNPKN